MKIFVIGGTGYLGQRILSELSFDESLQIVSLYREQIPAQLHDNSNLDWVHGDAGSPGAWQSEFRDADIFLYMGGIRTPGRELKREILFEENVEKLQVVLDRVAESEVGIFVYLADLCALGDTGNMAWDEAKPRNPVFSCNYEESHFRGVEIVRNTLAEKIPYMIAYTAPTYGKGDPGFLWPLLKRMALGKNKTLIGPWHFLSPIHIDELTTAVLQLIIKGADNEEYILCGEPIEMQNLSWLISSITKNKAHVRKFDGIGAYFYTIFSSLYNKELTNYLTKASYSFTSYKAKRGLRWAHRQLRDNLVDIFKEEGILTENKKTESKEK